MPEGTLVEALIIFVLVLANGFFSASEIAVVSSRKGRLEQRAADGQTGASTALGLIENPSRFLSTVQVGITLIGTLAAAFGGARFAALLSEPLREIDLLAPFAGSLALILVVVLISYLQLIVGELVPKRLALQNAEGIATAVAPLMQRLAWLATPVVAVLTVSSDVVLRLLGRHRPTENAVTEDDVMALVREGAAEGGLEEAEKELISSVFTFTERSVRSLMTPRTQVVAVEVDAPVDEVIALMSESGYSRVPVYEGSLDHIVGILYFKDLLRAWGHPETVDLREIVRKPLYLPESQRAVVAFQQLRQNRSVVAMVLDEYGQIAGLVTMEDMLEELVGEIDDEYDESHESIVQRADGSYLIDGLLSFAELRERLALPELDNELHERDFETVAGFLLALLGHIPETGEQTTWSGYTLEVVDMDGHRIDKVLLTPPAPDAPEPQPESDAEPALLHRMPAPEIAPDAPAPTPGKTGA